MKFCRNLKFLAFAFLVMLSAAFKAMAAPEIEVSSELNIDPNEYVIEGESTINSKIRATSHKDQDNYSVKIDLADKSFVIFHPTEQELEFYKTLSESDKIKFHAKRMTALNILARGLSTKKKGLGIGSLVKEKVMFWKSKKDKTRIPLAERSEVVVEHILRAFDKNIWSSAPIFTELKEIGLTGTGQIVVAAGSKERIDFQKEIRGKKVNVVVPEIKSGGAIGIGFTLGINFEQKSLVFQLFNSNEQVKEVKLPLLMVAGNLKGGMYISNSNQKLYSSQNAEAIYPFAAPGYVESAPTKKTFGSNIPFGIPLALSYTADMQEQSYLRISVSPFTWKFISVSMKNPFGIIKIGITRIPSAFRELGRIYNQFYYARSCRGLYL